MDEMGRPTQVVIDVMNALSRRRTSVPVIRMPDSPMITATKPLIDTYSPSEVPNPFFPRSNDGNSDVPVVGRL